MGMLGAGTFRFGSQPQQTLAVSQPTSALGRVSAAGRRLLSALSPARQQTAPVQQQAVARGLHQHMQGAKVSLRERLSHVWTRLGSALALFAWPLAMTAAAAGALVMPVAEYHQQTSSAQQDALTEIARAPQPFAILASGVASSAPPVAWWEQGYNPHDFLYDPVTGALWEDGDSQTRHEDAPMGDDSSFLGHNSQYDLSGSIVTSSIPPLRSVSPSVPYSIGSSSSLLPHDPAYNLRPIEGSPVVSVPPVAAGFLQVSLTKSNPTGYQQRYVQNMQQAYPQALSQLRGELTDEQYRRAALVPPQLVLALGAYEWRWGQADNMFGVMDGRERSGYAQNVAAFLKLVSTQRYYSQFQSALEHGASVSELVSALRQWGYNKVNPRWEPTVVNLAGQFSVQGAPSGDRIVARRADLRRSS